MIDVDRQRHVIPGENARATVLLFLGTQCPISNRYIPQLNEMAKNAKPEDQKALEDALEQANEMAKNQPPMDPKDLAELAKQLDKLSVPLVMIFAWVLLGEKLNWGAVAGGLLITAGAVVMVLG